MSDPTLPDPRASRSRKKLRFLDTLPTCVGPQQALAHTCTDADPKVWLDQRRCSDALFVRFVRSLAHGWVLFALVAMGCGDDAEQRYAGLRVLEVSTEDGLGYKLRYAGPPWKRAAKDPLELGTLRTVQIGDRDVGFVGTSARVLEIERLAVSTLDPTIITVPKYRLEAALLPCGATTSDCAAETARRDQQERADSEDIELLGAEVTMRMNDTGTPYFEFMSRDRELKVYHRVAYFETDRPGTIARLSIQAVPDPRDREVTRLIRAFEIVSGAASDTDANARKQDGGP